MKRNLYGSKSAPKLWYNCLYHFVIELGFKSVAGHPCLFIWSTVLEEQIIVIVIGIFVDDLLVTGNSIAEIEALRERMNKRFILTDQGKLEYYLGVEISRRDENDTLLLHQTANEMKILNHFKMNDCNPANTQLPRDINLSEIPS